MKLAILCHIYYPEIWNKSILPRLVNFPDKFDLYISISEAITNKEQLAKDIKAKFPETIIDFVPNLGEDVRGFFQSLKTLFSRNIEYDYILKIHTKSEDGWREQFLKELIDTYSVVTDFFNQGKDFISSKECYREYRTNRKINHEYIPQMMKMCGCKTDTSNHFSGTMFWVKYNILKRYFGNNQIPPEYFDQKYAKGRTKQHSCEILFGCIAKDCGNNIGLINIKQLPETLKLSAEIIHNIAPKVKITTKKRTMPNPPRLYSTAFRKLYRISF